MTDTTPAPVNRTRRRAAGDAVAWDKVNAQLEASAEARNADKAWAAALVDALCALDSRQLNALVVAGGPGHAAALCSSLGVRLDPRFVKRGLGPAVVPKLRLAARKTPVEIADLLLLPAIDPLVTDLLGDRVDDPTAADVDAVVALVDARFGRPVSVAYLWAMAVGGAPAAALLAERASALAAAP